MRFTLPTFLVLAMATGGVIASPVAQPLSTESTERLHKANITEYKRQDLEAQSWHFVEEWTGEHCAGTLIANHEGAFVFDVPMDDRTKSIWFYNGIHHWNGFERFSEPHLEPIQGFCRGEDYGELKGDPRVPGNPGTGCYTLDSNGHVVKCVAWYTQ